MESLQKKLRKYLFFQYTHETYYIYFNATCGILIKNINYLNTFNFSDLSLVMAIIFKSHSDRKFYCKDVFKLLYSI